MRLKDTLQQMATPSVGVTTTTKTRTVLIAFRATTWAASRGEKLWKVAQLAALIPKNLLLAFNGRTPWLRRDPEGERGLHINLLGWLVANQHLR
jgi:hypothetical protein